MVDNFRSHVLSRKHATVVAMDVWDTVNRGDQKLRPLAYPGTDVMLLCVDCSQPQSLARIEDEFLPEVIHFVPTARRALLVLKTDLRSNASVVSKLAACSSQPLSHEQCAAFARKHSLALFEVSAMTGDGMATAVADLVDFGIETSPDYLRRNKKSVGARFWSAVRSWFGHGE